jgi:GNAT superfamily N-acetyltransferase
MLDGLQLACPEDLQGIAFVKAQTWPEEQVRRDLIGRVLSAEDHCVHIVRFNRRIAGFVDGFMTLDHEGNRRWEVDLLAVHPSQRGKHYGEQLVKASMAEGRSRKAGWARALVGVENYASQVTFKRCGFMKENSPCSLFISRSQHSQDEPVPEAAYLLPVTTINYRGLWIENCFEPPIFAYAQQICHREGMDLVGAVIPASDEAGSRSARDAGFDLVGSYEWWNYRYSG